MTERGPSNGYFWTEREMMMRRDHIRWRNTHAWLRAAPVSAMVIGFPIGTGFGLAALVLSFLVQSYHAYSAFGDGRHQFSAPILVQRVIAGFLIATCLSLAATGNIQYLSGVFGAGVWLLLLWIIEARSQDEGEIARANREAMDIEQTWIKE